MDVSIIIVNYNTRDLLFKCITSIIKHTCNIKYEIIIVDNDSKDDSIEMIKNNFPSIILIESKENLGFGKANNLAGYYAVGKYLFFLNSDCVLLNNSVEIFFDYFECNNGDHSIGAIGSILLNEDKNVNISYHKFPSICNVFIELTLGVIKKLFNVTIKAPLKSNYIPNLLEGEVDFISGADLFIRKDVFELLNGFDNDFFLYFEETDLQMRMKKLCLRRNIIDGPKIVHYNGSTTSNNLDLLEKWTIFIDSMYKFFWKNYSVLYSILFWLIVTPVIATSLFNRNYQVKQKLVFIKVLFRFPYSLEKLINS